MLQKIWNYFKEKPYQRILILALLLRLIPLFFSNGFYAHDDHYLIVEVAQEWVEGSNESGWIVDEYAKNDNGRSIIYPGMFYILFSGMDAIGLHSPILKMFIVSLLHIVLSLWVVYLGMKITEYYNQKALVMSGLMLAGMWFMPFISVRTLIEVVAMTPLLYATWLIIKTEKYSVSNLLLIGTMIFLAFTIRYQTILVSAGLGFFFIQKKDYKAIFLTLITFLAWVGLVHGYGDYLLTTKPFGKLLFYFVYNVENANNYITRPVFDYVLFGFIFLLPPIGVLLFGLVWTQWKKTLPITLGVLFFFIVHSIIPNKQERFIFTLIPYFMILASLAYIQYFPKPKKWLNIMWRISLVVNIIMMGYLSTYYTKESRVEVMKYIGTKTDVSKVAVFPTQYENPNMVPVFYSGKTLEISYLNKDTRNIKPNEYDYLLVEISPEKSLREINGFLEQLGVSANATLETRIEGSIVDNFRYTLNKVIKNEEYFVYKLNQ